jgi:phosphatidylglycerol:prolipoprotein diacylglycerol transferase
VHPEVAYEMVLCLLILAAILPFQQRLKSRLPDGVLGLVYFALYAAGRFFLSYYRLDPQILFGLRQAQIASLLMVVVAVIAIPILFRRASTTSAPTQATVSRA